MDSDIINMICGCDSSYGKNVNYTNSLNNILFNNKSSEFGCKCESKFNDGFENGFNRRLESLSSLDRNSLNKFNTNNFYASSCKCKLKF